MLTAALALVALPGLAGSRAPSAVEPIPAGAFQPLPAPASESRSTLSIAGLDGGYLSAGYVDDGSDLHRAPAPARRRIRRHAPDVNQPDPEPRPSRKPPGTR